MKNIESRETQMIIAGLYCRYDFCDKCPIKKKCSNLYDRGTKNFLDERTKLMIEWFNDEYHATHHWEDWELETMRHLSTIYKYMKVNSDGNINLRTTLTASKQRCTGMRLDSIHDTDWLDIDAELKAYGMSRD